MQALAKTTDNFKLKNGCVGLEKLEHNIDNTEDGNQKIIISSRRDPKYNHAGNFLMFDVGSYGKGIKRNYAGEICSMNILSAIYETTKEDENSLSEPEKEKNLASLLLHCLKTGSPITTVLLKDKKYKLFYYEKKYPEDRKRVIEILNRILVLTAIKEIVRREHGSAINLPFAIAYVQGLNLVADGYLAMKDIFGRNAPYGLPTGEGLAKYNNRRSVGEKLESLNALYSEKYKNNDLTREYFHLLLLNSYGGKSDSDGEEYLSSEEEIQLSKKIFAKK